MLRERVVASAGIREIVAVESAGVRQQVAERDRRCNLRIRKTQVR
jgi:hypothetical protein